MKARININPPPEDGRCDCCRRDFSELTPFRKTGDLLVEDFDGELLIKTFKAIGKYDEQDRKAWKRVEKIMEKEGCARDGPLDWMIKIHGKEKGEQHLYAVGLYSQVGSSWECRDCVVLDEKEYFEQLEKTYSNYKSS